MSSRFESESALMLRQVSSANNLGSEDVLLTISLIYRVSIKSLYNLKKLLKSEIMRYRNEVCFMLISIS